MNQNDEELLLFFSTRESWLGEIYGLLINVHRRGGGRWVMPALIRSSTLKLSLNGTFVAILLCFTGSSPSKGRHARKELGNKWCWRVDVRKFPCVLYRFRLQVVDGHGYRERTSKKGRHPASGERERESRRVVYVAEWEILYSDCSNVGGLVGE